MMRTKKQISLSLALLLAVAASSSAQVVRRQVVAHSPDLATILEIQARVALADDGTTLEIVDVMSAANRPGDYKKVDLKSGDQILALNGQLMRSVEAFEAAYQATAIGETLELEVRRGDQRWIERFAKADPDSLPRVRRIEIQGNPEDMAMLMGLGVIFSLQEEQLRVNTLFPGSAGEEHFEVGDFFVSLNGNADLEPADLQELWQSLPVGDAAEFTLRREGQTISFSVEKAAFQGGVSRVIQQ